MLWPTHPRELGLVTTAEAVTPVELGGLGMTARAVEWAVTSGKWQRIYRGVYLMRAGGVDWLTLAAAALLAYGEGAAFCGPTAAVLHDLVAPPPFVLSTPSPCVVGSVDPSRRLAANRTAPLPGMPLIHVVVPRRIRPKRLPGTIVRHSDLVRIVPLWPRRTTFDCTVIDVLAAGGPDEVTNLLAAALRSRRTTAARLLTELERRSRHPQRALVRDILSEVAGGCESPLERRFVTDVLRRHGLPLGGSQWPAAQCIQAVDGDSLRVMDPTRDRRRFDRALIEFRVLVELDGAMWHYGSRRASDRHKSRLAARGGWLLLRYGWQECAGQPCATAAELAQELIARGWLGQPRPCGPRCPIRVEISTAG